MKLIFGIIFFIVDLGAFLFGGVLTLVGLGLLGASSGEGGIKIVVDKLGEVSGINGQLVVTLCGVFVVLTSLGYASKAVVEAMKYEGGLKDAVKHFNPSL